MNTPAVLSIQHLRNRTASQANDKEANNKQEQQEQQEPPKLEMAIDTQEEQTRQVSVMPSMATARALDTTGLTNSPDWTAWTEWREEGIPIIPLSKNDLLRGAQLQQAYLNENMPAFMQVIHDESIDWDYIETLEDEQLAYETALQQHEQNRQEALEGQEERKQRSEISSDSEVSIIGITDYCHNCGHVGLPEDVCVRCNDGYYQMSLLSHEQVVRHQRQWHTTHGYCAGHPCTNESDNLQGLPNWEEVSR